jgi:hypothetical protein
MSDSVGAGKSAAGQQSDAPSDGASLMQQHGGAR